MNRQWCCVVESSRDLEIWSKLSNYTNEILIVELHRVLTPRDRIIFVRTRCQFTTKSCWQFRLILDVSDGSVPVDNSSFSSYPMAVTKEIQT